MYSYAALCGLMYMGLKLNALADAVIGNPDRLIAPAENPETKVNLRFRSNHPEETNESLSGSGYPSFCHKECQCHELPRCLPA